MYAGDDPAMLCLIGTITGSSRSASPSLGFRSIVGALSTIDGYEATRMIRKGQVRWLPKGDVLRQRFFIHWLFGVAA